MDFDKIKYPVLELITSINHIFKTGNALLLQAPPGAGKSTVLPLALMAADWLSGKKILMLQPRRLATKAVASRMSALLQEDIGSTIGYRIRFESKVTAKTKIEVVTEGILTRMLQEDPTLEEVGMIVFDEFHERSLHADLAYVLCKEVQQFLRPDLKVLIMSATLNDEIIKHLQDIPFLKSLGKEFPVKIEYAPFKTTEPIWDRMNKTVRKVLATEEGDVLVFLPGSAEIKRTLELLTPPNDATLFLPLYGDLPFRQQQEAILPDTSGRRKVVLATSIAETSLTIEGIKTVIDSGLSRVPKFDPKTGLTRLETIPVSKDAADQRAGRAGRLGPGKCYRLWTEKDNYFLNPQRMPEILESDLSSLVLEIKKWGTDNMNSVQWITPPPLAAVKQAEDLLHHLGAIKDNKITEQGKAIISLPAHPRIAHLLLEGLKKNLLPLAIDIASIIEERDPLTKEAGADLSLRIEALRNYRKGKAAWMHKEAFSKIEKSASYWRKKFNIAANNDSFKDTDAGYLLYSAYPERIATQKDNDPCRYRMGNGKVAKLEEGDPLQKEKWLSIGHMDAGQREGKIFLAAPIDVKDFRNLIYATEKVEWNEDRAMVQSFIEKRLGPLILQVSPAEMVSNASVIKEVILKAIRTEGISFFKWDEEIRRFQARVASTIAWQPEIYFPSFSDHYLLENLEDWLVPYLSGQKKKDEINSLDFLSIFKNMLSWEQQTQLEEIAPDGIKVPTGSYIKLNYFEDGSFPVLAVRLQELFGLLDTPTVNKGKTKVMIHLLSPGYRPVQVTQDLKSFWTNTYSEVRKELRAKYPKHFWPENPLEAEPVRGVKRKQ